MLAWLVDFNKIFIISCACAYLESINVKVVWKRCAIDQIINAVPRQEGRRLNVCRVMLVQCNYGAVFI